ncbi:interleukin-17C-like [Centropristis striata]|uniref:interleukin-17C-like n=1 Tax=Centropristis striata TaxID=184440 RepID=UPI0027E0F98F|nr:interleukin-17C-like [Centropristis striata]
MAEPAKRPKKWLSVKEVRERKKARDLTRRREWTLAVLTLLTMSLGSLLLLFNNHTCPCAARCVNQTALNIPAGRFLSHYWPASAPPMLQPDTCAKAAKEMRGEERKRSLSPWIYRINQDDNRFPRKIFFAECLCDGCIINQQESFAYNSVQVFAQRTVLRKFPCHPGSDKYRLKKEIINIPVACTCIVPKENET